MFTSPPEVLGFPQRAFPRIPAQTETGTEIRESSAGKATALPAMHTAMTPIVKTFISAYSTPW
ncbi:hypothetical protein BDV33DRAFT_185426 [Aspergillus novoparasiticus]|uniref:Uncharacterized protein n=1 Tax=Aspergillus novoparasiticus TaxID=986946 RepID=A0A5N6E6X4_9EURO|nr:hypothetical protein BDV33DRAFT_185426 [Aspergillus novoparasiticus]